MESIFNEQVKTKERIIPMEQKLQKVLWDCFGKTIETASKVEIYTALLHITKSEMENRPRIQGERKLYYVSAEFLIGKLLSNNLINLGLFDETREVLARYGMNLAEIEDEEREPSLGNGGVGRLAACFLDSIAALNLCGDGAGLNYHELYASDLHHSSQLGSTIAAEVIFKAIIG